MKNFKELLLNGHFTDFYVNKKNQLNDKVVLSLIWFTPRRKKEKDFFKKSPLLYHLAIAMLTTNQQIPVAYNNST